MEIDRFTITRSRMAAGEAVGEGYLYGHDAAIAWEGSAKQRHEEAKVVFKAGKQA